MNNAQYEKLLHSVDELKTLKARKERLEQLVNLLSKRKTITLRVATTSLDVPVSDELWADIRETLVQQFVFLSNAYESFTLPADLVRTQQQDHAAAALLSHLSDDPEDEEDPFKPPTEDEEEEDDPTSFPFGHNRI